MAAISSDNQVSPQSFVEEVNYDEITKIQVIITFNLLYLVPSLIL